MSKLVFMVEESSMKEALNHLLPKIIPEYIQYQVIPHEGKSDLRKSIPRKLRSWNEPHVHFIILHDQDSNDCHALKAELCRLCSEAGHSDALIRIVCHELEAWFVGDLGAVGKAYDKPEVAKMQRRARFRDPDCLEKPSDDLERLLGGYSKMEGARTISQHLHLETNLSASFNTFVAGVRRIVACIPNQK